MLEIQAARFSAATPRRITSAARQAIAIVGPWVLPDGMTGITDVSMTRSPSTPRTRSSGSTTESGSLPIRQVPTV